MPKFVSFDFVQRASPHFFSLESSPPTSPPSRVQRLSLTVTRFSLKIAKLVFLARDRWYISSLLFQLQGASKLNQESSYDDSLKERALLSLREIKKEIDARSFHKADMWCHFGTVIIRDPDEGTLVYCNKLLLRRSFL